ncbi:MAG TPA: hypothetical protein VMW17_13075 [Candidatus Binatia bacterium]|nr:hypothetical protein [Candidatus Binatia bacterium]
MVKRFAIGFALGLGLMYYYLEHGEQLFSRGQQWMQRSASGYRNDRVHGAADEVVNQNR